MVDGQQGPNLSALAGLVSTRRRGERICVSGFASEDDQRRARESSFDEVMLEPPDLDALVRLVVVG